MRLLDFKIKFSEKNNTVYTYLREFFAGYTPDDTTPLLIHQLIKSGHVYVNRKLTKKENQVLHAKDRIKIYMDIQSPSSPKLKLSGKSIVFQDPYLVIINKPTGLASQSTNVRFETNAYDECRYLLNQNNNKKLQYLALLHRLDQPTSGLLLMSKSRLINAPMTQLFEKKQLQKKYLAIIEKGASEIKNEWEIKDQLIRKKTETGIQTTDCVTGGKAAHTRFNKIKENDLYALIEATPLTGRTHQIRYHLSKSGHPIVGDQKYGSKHQQHRTLLHAEKLSFLHPKTKRTLNICAPLPEDMKTLI